MKIEVNINKKYAFIIIGLLALLIIGVFGVYAAWVNPSSGMWHDANEVRIRTGTSTYASLQEVVTDKTLWVHDVRMVTDSDSPYSVNIPGGSPTICWYFARSSVNGGSITFTMSNEPNKVFSNVGLNQEVSWTMALSLTSGTGTATISGANIQDGKITCLGVVTDGV